MFESHLKILPVFIYQYSFQTPNEPKKPQIEPSNNENKDTIPNNDSVMESNDSNILQQNHSDANKKVSYINV